MATGKLDLSLVPGTPAEQRRTAEGLMRRKVKPIAIVKDGSRWRIDVLGTPIGHVKTKAEACSAAGMVGMYRLDLGQFAYTYTDGC